DYLFTVEDVNRLVLEGMPFREAYRTIGMQVQNGQYRPTRQINHTHLGSIGNPANDLIARKMNETIAGLQL
ncbi:MAG: argininosuccinate lyase, partial [Bacteroidales bacterium]|nr:argininosuccinate lyase [Bacteroidales bacterium]